MANAPQINVVVTIAQVILVQIITMLLPMLVLQLVMVPALQPNAAPQPALPTLCSVQRIIIPLTQVWNVQWVSAAWITVVLLTCVIIQALTIVVLVMYRKIPLLHARLQVALSMSVAHLCIAMHPFVMAISALRKVLQQFIVPTMYVPLLNVVCRFVLLDSNVTRALTLALTLS